MSAVTPVLVLVLNPSKVEDVPALQSQVARACAVRGLAAPTLLETTERDPGEGMARQALADRATVVLVAGGDGTVRSVACGLSGSGVPLALLPLGTGNLLARNLGIPLTLSEALDVALDGRDRRVDLGSVAFDGEAPTCFAVMTGLGFDAQMMADAPEHLKAAVGWPAYVVSGLRHLRDRGSAVTLVLDGRTYGPSRARGVVVGNVGRLQGGVALLPDARPDDGVLDIVVLDPPHLWGWLHVLARLMGRSRAEDRSLQRYRARNIEVRAHPLQQGEVDGEPRGPVATVRIEVRPGALVLRVPAV